MCAFANATGGIILIGVDDEGNICGLKDFNKQKSEIQSIARSVEPPIIIDIEIVNNVMIVSVPAQNSKPYSFAGKFYIRQGATSQQLSINEIREFFFKEGLIHFDEMINDSYDISKDLEDGIFKLFAKRSNIPEGVDKFDALSNLHLIKDNKMTNAGSWLLAKDITKYNISANISCALFMGSTKSHILDRKDFSGDLFTMYRNVIEYILSKINTEFIITSTGRNEVPEIPEEAIREAVVNAIAHRDYRSTANIQIYIFKDRLEIVSPGSLPAGMTAEDLGRKSIPRNPLLFGILFRMNLVEHIGSGITRINTLCKKSGIPVPGIDISDNWVSLSFVRKSGVQSQPESGVQSGAQSDMRGKVLAILTEKEYGKRDIAKKLGKAERTRYLNDLMKNLLTDGLVEYTIPDKPKSRLQKYRITNKGRDALKV